MDGGGEFSAGFYGESFARFDGLGEASVRQLLYSGGMVLQNREAALVWLGLKSSEKARNVRRAEITSCVALVISAISLAITGFVKSR
jgi:hypothetical protein